MKRQIPGMTVSSMTDRRLNSALLKRLAVKNALSSIRGWYGRLRREAACKDNKIERQNRVNEMGGRLSARRMQLDNEELRNLNNENLENELKELAMKIRC